MDPLSPQRAQSLDVGGLRVTSAWFAAGLALPRHEHERSSLAVVLRGGFEAQMAGHEAEHAAGAMLTTPSGEPHGNRFAPRATHVLVLEPEPRSTRLPEECLAFLGGCFRARDPSLAQLARRISAELREQDAEAPLLIEGLALELLATAARAHGRDQHGSGELGHGEPGHGEPGHGEPGHGEPGHGEPGHGELGHGNVGRPPAWLDRAVQQLRASEGAPPTLAELAHDAGVSPLRLLRAFRARYRTTPADYLRRLRVERVATRLRSGDEPIAALAAAEGFTDQSHLTRTFRRYLGCTPGTWRSRAQ